MEYTLPPSLKSHMLSVREEIPPGNYSLWWKSETEPFFVEAPIHSLIRETYEALSGIETFVFTALMEALEIAKPEKGRFSLPDELVQFVIQGQEEHPYLLTASSEKGIRLHFHEEFATIAYRDAVWEAFRDYAILWQGVVEREGLLKKSVWKNWLKREEAASPPLLWWQTMEKVLERVDKTESPSLRVGTIVCNAKSPD
jgi:hypothetical protein